METKGNVTCQMQNFLHGWIWRLPLLLYPTPERALRLAPFYTLVVLNRIMWRGHFIDLPHILLFTFLSAQIIFSMSMFIIVFLSYILILSMVLTIFRPPRFYPSSSLYSCPMSMFVPVLMSTSWFFLIIARWFSTSLWELHKLSSL